jgi:hypothetical protein
MFTASSAAVLVFSHSHSQSRTPQIEGANFLNLLIVDGDRTIREACREVAQSLGFNTQVAESAEQAYRLLDSTDAVLLDLRPGTGSLEALHDQEASRRRAGDCRDRLWHGAVGGAGHERWRLRLRHQALQHGRTAFAAGAGGDSSAAQDREPRAAGNHQVAAGVRQHHRARAGDGETLPHHRQSRTEFAPGADSGRKRHGQGVGREVDSLRRRLPQQAVHSGRLRVAGADADRKRTVRPRARRLHRRDQSQGRPAGDRRRGHGISGRDWRVAHRLAGQALAGDSGEGDSSGGKREAGARSTCGFWPQPIAIWNAP